MKRFLQILGVWSVLSATVLSASQAFCADGGQKPSDVASETAASVNDSTKSVVLGLDEGGNATVKMGMVSLSFVHGKELMAEDQKEKSSMSPPGKEMVGLGPVGIKLSFAF